VRGVKGGIFYGMVLTALAGVAVGLIPLPGAVVSPVPSLAPTFGVAITELPDILSVQMAVVVFSFLFVDFFDTAGTLIAVTSQAGLLTEDGKLPGGNRALVSDATATIAGGAIGTSTTTSYIESSAGVGAGGKTGLTSVVTAGLFLLTLLFSPLLAGVTSYVTAPALIIVGVMMARGLGQIAWDRMEIAIPAFVTVIMMPLTFSIANGIAMGLILYPLMMAVRGKAKEISPALYPLAVVLVAYFIWFAE
jgi:adenine/guanine/hypoxanthine permease